MAPPRLSEQSSKSPGSSSTFFKNPSWLKDTALSGLGHQPHIGNRDEQFDERRTRQRRVIGNEKTAIGGSYLLCERLECLEDKRLAQTVKQSLCVGLAVDPHVTEIAVRSNPNPKRPHRMPFLRSEPASSRDEALPLLCGPPPDFFCPLVLPRVASPSCERRRCRTDR